MSSEVLYLFVNQGRNEVEKESDNQFEFIIKFVKKEMETYLNLNIVVF